MDEYLMNISILRQFLLQFVFYILFYNIKYSNLKENK